MAWCKVLSGMEMVIMLAANDVFRMQDERTVRWHEPNHGDGAFAVDASRMTLDGMAEVQHRANFDLWHEEDKARDPGATDGQIAQVKHAIDRLNQRRVDLAEAIDDRLMKSLEQNGAATLHSETPGMMIDRMSIMALKIFHTREETMRASASQTHRDKNLSRLAVLMEQRQDLADCLDGLFADIRAGRRRFKVYRQMKMYNDPELNPVLYAQAAK